MTQATVAHINFTRNDLNVAGNAAIAKVGNDPKWVKIIYRALEHLAQGQFMYDGHVVTLRSASSDLIYRIDVSEPMKCTCKGRSKGYTCWHIAAARLIVRAAELHQQRTNTGVWYKGFYYTAEQVQASELARAVKAQMIESQRLVDELYA